MKLFPENADHQLEFTKIKSLLVSYCRSEFASEKAAGLRIHTRKEYIEAALFQTNEYKLIHENNLSFPDDTVLNLKKELRLLGIDGSMLSGEQFLQIKKLSQAIHLIFRWFNQERKESYPFLAGIIEATWHEKQIPSLIDEIIDETGLVRDKASDKLFEIRQSLYRKRTELKRVFDKVVSRLKKAGYLTDIEESFMNGRRVLAVYAEQKRMVKGILHGESDSRRTAFIEPAETTHLNNDILTLENEERKEVHAILRKLTDRMRTHHALLEVYHSILGEYDFVRAKVRLAQQYHGNLPALTDKAGVHITNAVHPLLYIYNSKINKPTVPVNLVLDNTNRILVISGPNAGGKTVTLKTVGLLQMMVQAGLLVSCSPDSEFGIFRQLMIHIGDTQSLEFELSTYSSHLIHMKYFMENAHGKTLFFIDELGSGSDPSLGGAFAEVIMEELARKHAIGIVTTHYLNLKVMADKVKGIINGAMAFDEKNLQPLYRLIVGRPGSSYTFSIAERIGLSPALIQRARKLVEESHFKLDKLLNAAEQDNQQVQDDRKKLEKLIRENERIKKEMERVIRKETHIQQLEMQREQNVINEKKLSYLKEMERTLKALISEWRKTDDKAKVIKMIQAALYKQPEKKIIKKKQQKIHSGYQEIQDEIKEGLLVLMVSNQQIGTVKEIRGKKAIIQIGLIPVTVSISDLVAVRKKDEDANK